MAGPWLLDPARALDPTEATRLLAAARRTAEAGIAAGRWRDARNGSLVIFLLATGLRISEALSVRIGDLSLRRDGGEVRVGLQKKRRLADGSRPPGVAFLSKPDTDDLRSWTAYVRGVGADDQTPCFPLGPPSGPRSRRPLSRQAASIVVKRLLAGVGIERPGVAAHALRHAVGVATQAATGNTRVVQARLHHSSVRTSETYARVPVADYRAAIGEVASLLRGG
jgi:integrase